MIVAVTVAVFEQIKQSLVVVFKNMTKLRVVERINNSSLR